jgi:hypothetical protein
LAVLASPHSQLLATGRIREVLTGGIAFKNKVWKGSRRRHGREGRGRDGVGGGVVHQTLQERVLDLRSFPPHPPPPLVSPTLLLTPAPNNLLAIAALSPAAIVSEESAATVPAMHLMNFLLAFFAFAPTTLSAASLKGSRPNVIVLFADDYG